MRFLIDTNLPPALARFLTVEGHSAEHVLDISLGKAKDRLIWEHAASVGAAIVSKDEDFVILKLRTAGGPQIVWVRYGNMRRTVLIARFAETLPALLAALSRGEPIVELI